MYFSKLRFNCYQTAAVVFVLPDFCSNPPPPAPSEKKKRHRKKVVYIGQYLGACAVNPLEKNYTKSASLKML